MSFKGRENTQDCFNDMCEANVNPPSLFFFFVFAFCEWNSALKHTIGGQNMSSRNSRPSRGRLSPQAKVKEACLIWTVFRLILIVRSPSEVQTNASLSISRNDAG